MADTLTIVDNRTGKKYELPIEDGTIRAVDLRQVKTSPEDFGLMTYDPAFMNTANCRSAITFIDGDKGILQYRGYPIEQLAEGSDYLETAYLLLFGELFDRIAAVEEDALVAVDVSNRAAAVRGVHERRVVRHQAEFVGLDFDLAQVHRAYGRVAFGSLFEDRDRIRLAGSAVLDLQRARRSFLGAACVRAGLRRLRGAHAPLSLGVSPA